MPDNDKKYKLPPIVWLKVTDYMHGWLQWELGGALRIRDRRVISILHLPGVRDVMRDEIVTEKNCPMPVGNSLSALWKNCIETGIELDESTTSQMYGIDREALSLYAPIECPKMCLTESGVIRPWINDVNLSPRQAGALQKIIRNEFWSAVVEFAERYAQKHEGEKYAQIEMIENFCQSTKTPEMYAETIRREWQRRVKRRNAPK